jgi:hypothetical protein
VPGLKMGFAPMEKRFFKGWIVRIRTMSERIRGAFCACGRKCIEPQRRKDRKVNAKKCMTLCVAFAVQLDTVTLK